MKKALIGFCPIGKFAFSHEQALIHKQEIEEKMTEYGIDYIGIDAVIKDGIIRSQNDVEPVVDYFRAKKIDGLFLPHCNFGTEGAAALIAKKLNVPVLLYGVRDEAPDQNGYRKTDCLCGTFATSKVLRKLEVPFTYIENCRIGEKPFETGLKEFSKVCRVVSSLYGMRIGQIGGRIDFFWCTIIDETDLLRKFNVQIQPIDLVYFIRDVKALAEKNYEDYQKELAIYKKDLINTDNLPDTGFINGLAARDHLKRLAEELQLDGFAIQSFPSLCEALGDGGELGMSLIQEEIPIGVETDIHAVISSVLLRAAADADTPCFMPEWTIRHPYNDNAAMLWHGNCPPSLKKPGSPKMEILPSWIMPTEQRTNIAYPIRDGFVTTCRFEGENGEYFLGIGKGKTVDGPKTLEVYTYIEVSDWAKYEKKLVMGVYPHHCSCIFDDCGAVLEKACEFIPFLKADHFDKD